MTLFAGGNYFSRGGTGGGLSNVVEDTTPQLGGDLDVNGNDIVSTSNADINVLPNGTGDVSLGTFLFDADQSVGAGQDNFVLTYDNVSGKILLEAAPGAGGGINNVVEDTTPQLGGDLDANTFDILFDDATGIHDSADNEQLLFQQTASAITYLEITNAATGNPPSLAAVGETNVDLVLLPSGTGAVSVTGTTTYESNVTDDDDIPNKKFVDDHTWVEADITDLQAYLLDITGENLSTLADVTITGIASGELIKWDGAAWINNTLAEAGISATGHTHTESDITDLQSYLLNVVEDTTPQLGGDLDVQANAITTATVNGDIAFTPNGTGVLSVAAGTYEANVTADDDIPNKKFVDDHTWVEADITDLQAYLLDITGENLSTLADVTITGIASGELLKWSGSAWVNNTLAEAGVQAGPLTGDVTTSGAAATIADEAVTLAKMAHMATASLLGRDTAATGDVEVLSATTARSLLNVEDGADVTDTSNVTAAGALMDSEVDADIKTLLLPANTTISTFGATLVDDANAAAARTTLVAQEGPLTGDVTTSGAAATIAAKAVDVAMLADGTDGELITWDATGVAATVPVGTATHVLTSNGVGAAPTFQAATGGLSDVVDDTTPQLGGSLDVNGNKIVSVSNGDIDVEPNGTGNVLLGNFTFDADQTVGVGQDDYVLTYDNAAGTISLEAAPGAGGGINNVVEDLTPQLGGDLDANTFDILFDTTTGIRDELDNEQLIFNTTASAVNNFEMTNAATGNSPALAAVGGDANIDLVLTPKGSGAISVPAGTYEANVTADDDIPNKKFVDDHTWLEADITDLQAYLLDITGENLSSLADVTITGIASGELLKWDGAAWINNTLAEAGVQAGPLTGDVTTSGAAATIADEAVTLAKMAHMATASLLGRDTAATGDVEVLSATTARSLLNVEDGADVTDTANVTSAGALMDSEVDADIKTLLLPANTTISTFGATLVDDANAAAALTTLGAQAGPLTGDVTTSGAAATIAAKAVDVAMLADGTDGELITWDAAGVAAVVPVGTATHVLTSNGVGAAPTFQAGAASDKVYRIPHTWAIGGEIKVASGDTDFIPEMYVDFATGQTMELVGVRYRNNGGTSCNLAIQVNGVDATGFDSLACTTTVGSAFPTAVTLSDGDKVALVVNSVAGTPTNLTCTMYLESTQ